MEAPTITDAARAAASDSGAAASAFSGLSLQSALASIVPPNPPSPPVTHPDKEHRRSGPRVSYDDNDNSSVISSLRSRSPHREEEEPPTLPPNYPLSSPEPIEPDSEPLENPDLKDIYLLVRSSLADTKVVKRDCSVIKQSFGAINQKLAFLDRSVNHASTTAAEALSNTKQIAEDLTSIVARISKLEEAPAHPNPRPTSAPPNSRNATSYNAVDHFEAVILAWPNFYRTALATPFVEGIVNLVPQFCPTMVPITGSYCRAAYIRFPTVQNRRDFIKHVNSNKLLSISPQMYVKTVVPKDIAEHSDTLASSKYWLCQHLRDIIDVSDVILSDYSVRTLCMYDVPVCYYVDDKHERMPSRTGGVFCIDRTTLSRIAQNKNYHIDVDGLVAFLGGQFKDRTIVEK